MLKFLQFYINLRIFKVVSLVEAIYFAVRSYSFKGICSFSYEFIDVASFSKISIFHGCTQSTC